MSSKYGKRSPGLRNRPSALTTACSSRKRRRSAIAMESDASPWASLNEDLVRLIGWRVLAGDLLDYVRFRAVCPYWRSSTICPRGRGLHDPRFHPRRWMMLPEGHGLYPGHGKLGKYIRFINLSTGAIVRSKLPIFSHHCVLDSTEGILVLQRDQDTAIILLHPFTGDTAELPPLSSLRSMLSPTQEKIIDWSLYRMFSATSFSVSTDGVATVMVVFYHLTRVACATTMDQQWQLSTWTISNYWRPMSFQGKIYTLHCHTLDSELQILQIDLPRHGEKTNIGSLLCDLPEPKLFATFPSGRLHTPYHLGECDSEILLIGRKGCGFSTHVEVYKLVDNIALDNIVPVTSIGSNSLFIEDRVLSVNSRVNPTIVPDAVVLCHPKEPYIGQYHLASETWFRTDGCIKNGGIPSPCSLIYHIFTCCHRTTWNKGAILFQGWRQPTWKVKRKFRAGA